MPQDRKLIRATASLANAVDTRKQCQAMLDKANRAELRAMVRAVDAGLSQAEAGRMMGLSHGRVFQLLQGARASQQDAEPQAS